MKVYSVVQDHQGFIWIATEAGIARFDGDEFQCYSISDGLPDNDVINIATDSKGRIWLGGVSSLAFFDGEKFHKIQKGVSYNYLGLTMQEMSNGDFWIAWNGKLLHLNENLEEIAHPWNNQFDAHSSLSIVDFRKDTLWIRYRDEVYYADLKSGTMEKIPLGFSPSDDIFFTSVLYKDDLYYTCKEGIVKYDLHSGQEQLVLSGLSQLRSLEIHEDYLWITIFGQGISKMKIQPDGTLSAEKTQIIGEQNTKGIIWDKEGNTWIPSLGNGIFFYPAAAENMKIFTTKEGLQDPNVQDLYCPEDSIWVANTRSGISLIYNGKVTNYQVDNFRSRSLNRILKIQRMPSGAFLLATDIGLIRWTPEKSETILAPSAKSFWIGDDDQVLLTTHQGAYTTTLTYLDSAHPQIKHIQENQDLTCIYSDRSYATLIDKNGDLWFCSARDGLIQVHQDKLIYWKDKDPIFSSLIVEMNLLADSTMVLATNGNGIILVKDASFLQITKKEGLSSNVCYDLAIDEEWIWVAHNYGISGIRDFNFKNQTFDIKVFTQQNGLISNEIETIEVCGDKLILGANQSVLMVDKKHLVESNALPSLHVTDYWVNGEKASMNDLMTLKPDQTNLRFKYSAISFSNQKNIIYQYKLNGGDDYWQNTRSREIQFSNLNPGQYKLELRILQDGKLGETFTIPVFITKHFYKTLWFQFLTATAIFFIVGLIFYTVYNASQRQVLEKIVREKTANLKEKLEDLATVNQQLKRSNNELEQFAHAASHDLKAPLRNVASFIQILGRTAGNKLDEKEKGFLDFAIKGTRRMDEIINDLLEFAKVNQNVLETEIVDFKRITQEIIDQMGLQIAEKKAQVEISGQFPKLVFSRMNAMRLIENLLSNALKYHEAGYPIVNIHCEEKGGNWLFSVKDNGIGIDPKYQDKVFQLFQRLHNQETYSGTGLGLAICKKIVEKSKGHIWFESKIAQGTTFFFTLPAK